MRPFSPIRTSVQFSTPDVTTAFQSGARNEVPRKTTDYVWYLLSLLVALVEFLLFYWVLLLHLSLVTTTKIVIIIFFFLRWGGENALCTFRENCVYPGVYFFLFAI